MCSLFRRISGESSSGLHNIFYVSQTLISIILILIRVYNMGVNIYSEIKIMRLDISVRTGGSYSSYLAYGTVSMDKFGDEIFTRKGYISTQDKAPKGVLVERKSEGKYGSASHYYHYIIEVEEDFKFFILEVGGGKQTTGSKKIIFTPLCDRKESAQVEALENLLEQTAPIDSEVIASLKNSLNLPSATPQLVDEVAIASAEIPTVAEQLELASIPEAPQIDRREWINPTLIILDKGTQTRTESLSKIEEYSEMMKADLWDWTRSDIVIYEDKNGAYPSDGHHRIMAAIVAGVEIFAEVRSGSLRDAIFESFASNKFHGLPLSREDKNNRIRTILLDSEWQQMSDRAIADHCGVSTPFVGKVRGELVASNAIAATAQRKGKDGRVQASKKSKSVLVENIPSDSLLEQKAIAPVESLPEQITPIPEYIADDIKKPVEIADENLLAAKARQDAIVKHLSNQDCDRAEGLESAKRIADTLTYNQLLELETYIANLLPEF
jgi:hypothetical protein